jgi:hypothetical protein
MMKKQSAHDLPNDTLNAVGIEPFDDLLWDSVLAQMVSLVVSLLVGARSASLVVFRKVKNDGRS